MVLDNLTALNSLEKQRIAAKAICRQYFLNDYGTPLEITDGQADIFIEIVWKQHSRVEVIAPTQYGKSNTIACALIVATQLWRENFAIVTGSQPKSMIIMEKVIVHLFDHQIWYSALELDPNEPLDRIRRQRSRENLNWKGGGGIRIFTADARNRQRVKESLTGFGAPNIIEDEASLIPDDLQAMILRMLGGHQVNFLFKIGNPFYKNHFYKTWNSDKYHKIFIDYNQALAEGRYTTDFVDEMRDEPFFSVLYECLFPDDNTAPEGYLPLVSTAVMDSALISNELPVGHDEAGNLIDKPILGIDPNHGGSNYTAMVVRYPLTGFAKVVLKKRYDNGIRDITGKIVEDAEDIIRTYNIGDYRIGVDAGGVGAGVADGLEAKGYLIQSVLFGQAPDETQRYANKKAELYWNLRKWLRTENGKLLRDDGFLELNEINYKENTSSKTQMESKAELAKRGVQSPDIADALALTFVPVNDIVDNDDDFDL